MKSFFEGFDPGRNDDVIGFAWFNLAVTTYVDGQLSTNDWRVDSRANSLAAFSGGIAEPTRDFGGKVLGGGAAPGPSAPLTPTPTPSTASTPTPSATPSPTPTPTPTPSATPAPTPTPSPSGTGATP